MSKETRASPGGALESDPDAQAGPRDVDGSLLSEDPSEAELKIERDPGPERMRDAAAEDEQWAREGAREIGPEHDAELRQRARHIVAADGEHDVLLHLGAAEAAHHVGLRPGADHRREVAGSGRKKRDRLLHRVADEGL